VVIKKKIQARGEKIQAKYGQLLIIRKLGGGLYPFYCAIQADFIKKIQARGKKIQANDGHMLIIRELGGSLYLFAGFGTS
jgi:hypothetical protein